MNKCRQLHEGFLCTQALMRPLLAELREHHHWGFVYAGLSECGLIKVGMSHQQCPFCRMEQNNLIPRGLVFSENVWYWEQEVIRVLGTPAKGKEWFSDPKASLRLLVDLKLIHRLVDVESFLVGRYG